MGMQPVRETPSTVASVASKQVVRPIFWQVMHGVGVTAVDDRGFADDESLSSKQAVPMAFSCIGRFCSRLMWAFTVHV